MIQSDFADGENGNFEAVVLEGNRLDHYFHNNDDVRMPWSRGQRISNQATAPACIIQSDFMVPWGHGNLEVVVLEGNDLVHYYHDNSDVTLPWQRGQVITTQATGPGSVIQSDYADGGHGNFEVVALEGNDLVHYYHDNSDVTLPWQRGGVITTQATGAGSIIQGDYADGGHGNFEVVVLEGNNLAHYYRDNSDSSMPWRSGGVITTQATGAGSIIQSSFGDGTHGNFEVVVPEGSNLVHYFRDNSRPDMPWLRGQTVFGQLDGLASLIQSDFAGAEHGNFEVVAIADSPECHTEAPCVSHFFHINTEVTLPWERGQVIAYTGKSQKICQLDGDWDLERMQPTENQTEDGYGLEATDSGFSFMHEGRLYVLFGDTDGHGNQDDAYATSDDFCPEDGMALEFFAQDSGTYRPLEIPGVPLGNFEIPMGGFSAPSLTEPGEMNIYVFAWTGASFYPEWTVEKSVLAVSWDDGDTFQYRHDVSFDKFRGVTPVVVDNADVPGVPEAGGQGLLMWGMGEYRRGSPYLAWQPLGEVEDPQSMRYFAGLGFDDQPIWSEYEADAVELFDQPCVGELSVTWNPWLNQWLMLYNCDPEYYPDNGDYPMLRGIDYRVADLPWGEWSEPALLFDPVADGGYCHFMHDENQDCDRLNKEGGGEYAPYVVPAYTTGDATSTTIYYIMSTWRPYHTVLMRSTLSLEDSGGNPVYDVCDCRSQKCSDCAGPVATCTNTPGCPQIIQCVQETPGCNLPHECSLTCESGHTPEAIAAARQLASCFGGCD